jgi:hypothetical protein
MEWPVRNITKKRKKKMRRRVRPVMKGRRPELKLEVPLRLLRFPVVSKRMTGNN